MRRIHELIDTGVVQLSDRRSQPRFRFRSPVEVVAVDVVGAIVPTSAKGWTTDVSAAGSIITLEKQMTCKGLFVKFAESDDLVVPARIVRTVTEENGFFSYAIEHLPEWDHDQLMQILNYAPAAASAEPASQSV